MALRPMTRNNKPGELPEHFDEQLQNAPQVAILVADQRLTRRDVVDYLEADVSGKHTLDLDTTSDGNLSHDGLAHLFKFLTMDGRTIRRIKADLGKTGLAKGIADAADAGVVVDDAQDGLRKEQLIRVWLSYRDPDADLAGAASVPDRRGGRQVAVPDGGD